MRSFLSWEELIREAARMAQAWDADTGELERVMNSSTVFRYSLEVTNTERQHVPIDRSQRLEIDRSQPASCVSRKDINTLDAPSRWRTNRSLALVGSPVWQQARIAACSASEAPAPPSPSV